MYNEEPKMFINILCGLALLIIYLLYLRKFKYYIFREENHHPLLKRNF